MPSSLHSEHLGIFVRNVRCYLRADDADVGKTDKTNGLFKDTQPRGSFYTALRSASIPNCGKAQIPEGPAASAFV